MKEINVIIIGIILLILWKIQQTQRQPLPPQKIIKRVVYDNTPLSTIPLNKKINTTVNCNTNIVECNNDSDCFSACISGKGGDTKCLHGFCGYQINSSFFCQNNGRPVTSSLFNYVHCLCPPEFVGHNCEIENKMI